MLETSGADDHLWAGFSTVFYTGIALALSPEYGEGSGPTARRTVGGSGTFLLMVSTNSLAAVSIGLRDNVSTRSTGRGARKRLVGQTVAGSLRRLDLTAHFRFH